MALLNVKSKFHTKQHQKNHNRNLRRRYERLKKTTTKVYVHDERQTSFDHLTGQWRQPVEFEFGLLDTIDHMRTKIQAQMEIPDGKMRLKFQMEDLPTKSLVGNLWDWANRTAPHISLVN